MTSLRRLVVCLLLAVAVPVQGVAATTMVACAPLPQGAPGAMTGHGQHGAARTDRPNSVAPQAPDAAEPAPVAKGSAQAKCAACSACCIAAAAPAQAVAFEGIAFDDSLVPPEPRSIAPFVSERLERPPRPYLV